MAELISINEAAEKGITRLRLPIWANPKDHIAINVFDGKVGPWIRLWCPFNTECNGRDPVDVLCIQFDLNKAEYEPYSGPLPTSDEYKAEVAKFSKKLLGVSE